MSDCHVAPIPKSANWAVGSGIAVSVFAYEYCQYQRRVERGKMKRVVEVVTKKQKKAEEEARAQLQTNKKPEATTDQQVPAKKSWFRFW